MPNDRPQTLPPVPETRRFEWLREPKGRRSALIDVEKAVRQGWNIDDDGRAELVKELSALIKSDELTGREKVRVMKIFNTMCRANTMEEAIGGAS